MKYKDMPKGDNNDICVRCGKQYNFADKALFDGKREEAKKFDMICICERTNAGFIMHGNVKLCGDCMSNFLDWLEVEL